MIDLNNGPNKQIGQRPSPIPTEKILNSVRTLETHHNRGLSLWSDLLLLNLQTLYIHTTGLLLVTHV